MIGSNLSFRVYHVDKNFNSTLYRYLLRRVIFPKLNRKYEDSSFVFQQDNASIHTSELIRNFLIDSEVEQLFWPPCSPDLSSIENLWGILQKRVNYRLRSNVREFIGQNQKNFVQKWLVINRAKQLTRYRYDEQIITLSYG